MPWSTLFQREMALQIWKTLQNWVHGILAQKVVCKHTHKMMLCKWSSAMMSGGPSLVSKCLSMMKSGHLSVIMSGCLSVMPVTIKETSSPKIYTGLENEGATCYLNTVLQILFMTKDFRKIVERYPMNNSTISNHIAQLFEHLKSGQRTIATTEGITADLKINVHKQEDAAKCLQKILNRIEPEMSEIFQGIQEDTTICKNPAKYHEPLKQVKSFFIISISLESQAQIYLQSCFDSYFESINMCGEDEQIYCNDCQMMMETEISCSLLKVPSVLVLQLERFELDYDTNCCVKNDSSVQIPAQLLVKDKMDLNHMYDLYAIANHIGSLSSGHYYADIKSFEDQKWYRFNDSSVQNVNQKFDLDNHLPSDEAYLLFYKKSASETVLSDN